MALYGLNVHEDVSGVAIGPKFESCVKDFSILSNSNFKMNSSEYWH